MSLVKNNMLDNIKKFYKDDVLFSIFLRVCQKNLLFKMKLIKFLPMFPTRKYYIVNLEFVFQNWRTISKISSMIVTIF